MQQYQTRVRKFRKDGRQRGRSTDGIRQNYRDDAIIAAKRAARREQESTKDQEQENTS